jgi:hypothetical protein
MKTKHAVSLVAVVFGLAATLFAADQLPLKVHTQTLKIKAHGETVAELKVSTRTPIRIDGGGLVLTQTGTMAFVSTVKGGITVRINGPGELPITLKADEVELTPERLSAPLFAE